MNLLTSLLLKRGSGFNIFSLAVAPTDDERLSRITIVVDVESAPLEQITKQLDKLINVVEISELDPRYSVERELILATVSAPPAVRRRPAWTDRRGPGTRDATATFSSGPRHGDRVKPEALSRGPRRPPMPGA